MSDKERVLQLFKQGKIPSFMPFCVINDVLAGRFVHPLWYFQRRDEKIAKQDTPCVGSIVHLMKSISQLCGGETEVRHDTKCSRSFAGDVEIHKEERDYV